MDESSGAGLTPPYMKQSIDDDKDASALQNKTKERQFNSKRVKSHEEEVNVSSSKPGHLTSTRENKKKLEHDYVISHEQGVKANLVGDNQSTDETDLKNLSEYYFVDSLSKQKLIAFLFDSHPPLTTICIRSLEDLEKHGLMTQTWVEDGQLQNAEGRLFLEQPLTLIFDLTEMTPTDIANFNDMLQESPSWNNKVFAPQVKRVCLVNIDMIKGNQISNPDLWRRIGKMTEKEIPASAKSETVITDEALIAQMITEKNLVGKKEVILDFAQTNNWYHYLFGGADIDEKGQLIFSEGALAHLTDDVHLVLKNAPWDAEGFKETLAAARRNGVFESNQQQVPFPKNITLFRQDTSQVELETLKNEVVTSNDKFNADKTVVCVNVNMIENLKVQTRIEGTHVVHTNMLANLLNGCSQLVITSSLDKQHWLWLLTQLKQMPKEIRPALFINLPADVFIPANNDNWVVLHDSEELIKKIGPGEYFKYDVSANDSLESLCSVNLMSQSDFTFSLENSPLFTKLKKGKLVILSGLEKNPKLAASLESLFLRKPYLFINGHKVDLSASQIAYVKSADKHTFDSPLVEQAFSQCDEKSFR